MGLLEGRGGIPSTKPGTYTQPSHLKGIYAVAANKTALRAFIVERGGWR